MSAETKQTLEAAIAAHIADEGDAEGSIITGWALIAAHSTATDFDDEITRYLVDYANAQPFHVGLGLVHRHRIILEREADE
jgi:hypothetical protein